NSNSILLLQTYPIPTRGERARPPYFKKKFSLEAQSRKATPATQVLAGIPETSKKNFSKLVFPQHPRWQNAVMEDKGFGSVVRALRGEPLDTSIPNLKNILPCFTLYEGILCHVVGNDYHAVVPYEFRRQILTSYHNNPIAGHRGTEQTLNLIAKSYFWPGLASDVKNFVSACLWCSTAKTRMV